MSKSYTRNRNDAAYDVKREHSTKRYGKHWRKIRAAYIRVHPLCEISGCEKAAEDVDHIVSLAQGGTHEWSNLQSLCRQHHNYKTRGRAIMPGADASGMPLDPAHPWCD